MLRRMKQKQRGLFGMFWSFGRMSLHEQKTKYIFRFVLSSKGTHPDKDKGPEIKFFFLNFGFRR